MYESFKYIEIGEAPPEVLCTVLEFLWKEVYTCNWGSYEKVLLIGSWNAGVAF